MKHKSETFGIFQYCKSMVENEYVKNLNTLIIDNEGELIKNDFNACLSKHGIQHQNTIPYTPQQNEVAKRNTITLV